jgi:hypothetical protein
MESPPDNERNKAGGGKRKRPPTPKPPLLRLVPNHRSPVDGNRRGGLTLQGSNETVSVAGYGFDVPWLLGGVAQRLPKPVHCRVEAVLEIDERPVGPDLREQLLARHQFARLLQQGRQNLEGLSWQTYS